MYGHTVSSIENIFMNRNASVLLKLHFHQMSVCLCASKLNKLII